ncbi:Short chain dehydrogenase family protein [Bosea sp. LC85]|uniref:SDR family oxidoreductase n=1 Tax=Bosea sp. LC85 TaxID=1502851 RepID=UPI0004E45178|nr:SDR family oxidoreductase [Bosea sp. LC85]KFC74604.1 Short chain dehydrogenase family protein [Bosea sp. LC85]
MAEVALITGGARRIGRAIVEHLANAGYAVAIHYRTSQAEAESLAAEVRNRGGRAITIAADLADPAAVDAMIPTAEAKLGPVTLLVNSASSFLVDDIRNIDVPTWNRQFSTNLRAPSVLSGAMANHLPGDREGCIVNIIDQRVWKPTPQYYSYTLTKSALLTATITMAQALAPRIRVNAVGPGPTFPNPQDGDVLLAREAAGSLLQRKVDAADIAGAVLYLARARSVTGQMIAVDNGQHLAWRTPDIVT